MYKQNKIMLKVKNLIKNTPSKLHHIHQRRGVLRTPSIIQEGDFCKNSQGTSVVNCFCKKNPSRKPGRVPHTCYKIVVRKLIKKWAKKVKN